MVQFKDENGDTPDDGTVVPNIDKRSTYAGRRPALVVAYLHNGFSVEAATNEIAAEVLKGLLIPNADVKSLRVYHGEKGDKLEVVEALNYTKLTARRARHATKYVEREQAEVARKVLLALLNDINPAAMGEHGHEMLRNSIAAVSKQFGVDYE